ncbi:glycosyltransferase family 2 protein, partial [Candidatus Gottesmanbacteria bacterium]|nr:glycosyltransferase family 2 protein [Candidatus Gottesmanbacteria bacterium]
IGKNPKWEVIIVDNDKENVGFGAGCNKGGKKAKGKYLFFLNPDTIILPGAMNKLVDFMEQREDIGIVAPLLLNENKMSYPLQGARELTPFTALVALSFLNKYFPNNPVSFRYWLKDWDKRNFQEVAVVPGTAFMIRRGIFEKIGGFDENFFLYFEETDLCQRVKEKGWKIFIEPESKVIHFWKGSTPKNGKIKKIFCQSRFYYFKKHWGVFPAVIVESILRSGEWLAEKI